MKGAVRKRGTSWSYYFDLGVVDGKRKKKEKGGFRTKREADTALRNAMKEYENAGAIVMESNITVSDYFDYWYKEYVLINCKYNTQQAYRIVIDKHIKPALGVYKLKSISPSKLQEFFNLKYRNGYTKSSLSNFYGVLSGAFKMAVFPYKLIKESPVSYVKLPKYNTLPKKQDDLKIITVSKFKQIIDRFPAGSSFYIPLQIGFNTGMRAAEVCGLTWDCVDLDMRTITVEKILIYKDKEWIFGTPKTASSNRTIYIGPTLYNILHKHKLKQKENRLKYGRHYTISNFVCTKENGQLVTMDSLKYLSRIINYELGIRYNFHSLRHSHATMLLEAGANIKDIQNRLGHSNLSTTMDTYSHVTQKMKKDSVDIFEKALATQI